MQPYGARQVHTGADKSRNVTAMRFKMWLRGPADNPEVEVIGEHTYYWRSGHWRGPQERSVMAELLTPDEIRHLEISEGRWFLPGPPP